ncbi:MAG: response regulator [candidate division Zixibacteria bacterium]|nr:response regulator [candidate division Zixibacteria bacterium]
MTDTCRTLLIVDDEPNVIKALKRLFFDTGYKIITAVSGAEGLEKLQKHQVQLVISDFLMPDMDGVEFLAKVKESYPDAIRMILSGYADISAIVGAINDGHVYKFIAKPWNDQELLTTIMRAFEQYNLQRENKELYEQLQSRNRELEELAITLEDRVEERTRDLQMKNRALKITQSILNYLPVGVIGIDSEEMVVYMNDACEAYVGRHGLALGMTAGKVVSDEVLNTMMMAIDRQETLHITTSEKQGVEVICTPLADMAGVIGLFHTVTVKGRSNEQKLSQETATE